VRVRLLQGLPVLILGLQAQAETGGRPGHCTGPPQSPARPESVAVNASTPGKIVPLTDPIIDALRPDNAVPSRLAIVRHESGIYPIFMGSVLRRRAYAVAIWALRIACGPPAPAADAPDYRPVLRDCQSSSSSFLSSSRTRNLGLMIARTLVVVTTLLSKTSRQHPGSRSAGRNGSSWQLAPNMPFGAIRRGQAAQRKRPPPSCSMQRSPPKCMRLSTRNRPIDCRSHSGTSKRCTQPDRLRWCELLSPVFAHGQRSLRRASPGR
jgi:hypothetical protein